MSDRSRPQKQDSLSFGPFRLHLAERLLFEGNRPVRLGSRAMDILMALVERPGELVGKRELFAKVWPNASVVEANLTVHIASLRRALGDSHGANRYILNSSGRGYRFVAPIVFADHAPAAPPVSALGEEQHNLPAQLTRLIGRADIVADLEHRILSQRLLTLVGPGGIGKTATALQVAERLIGQFRDGVWLIDLAPIVDPALVPATVASCLKIATGLNDPTLNLVNNLRGKHLMLLLDNCEHVVDQVAELANRILRNARGVHVLTTSREPLRLAGEHVCRLPPLQTPPVSMEIKALEALSYPAVELFVERAAAMINDFELADADASAAGDLCRQLDGMPLAIEFAAARIDTFSIRGLAERLGDRLSLSSVVHRERQPRHQTIGATLDWSYELLGPEEQLVFRCLGIFLGGFTLDAAEHIASDAARIDVGECVANLVLKSLVVATPGEDGIRLHLLETSRMYALMRLTESGELDAVARRHVLYFTSALEVAQAKAGTVGSNADYHKEIDNIRAALEWSFGPNGDAAIAVALSAASALIWNEMALLTECYRTMERALKALADTDRGTRREMLLQGEFGLAFMYVRGVGDEARRALVRASDVAADLGDFAYQVRALIGLANLSVRLEDFHGAFTLAKRAEEAAIAIDDQVARSMAEFLYAGSLSYLGQWARAEDYARLGLQRIQRVSRDKLVVRAGMDHDIQTRCVLASDLWAQGLLEQAHETTTILLGQAREKGHGPTLCFALAWSGCPIAARIGDDSSTANATAELRDCSEKHGLSSYRSCALGYEGLLLAKRREFPAAIASLQDCLAGLRQSQFEVHLTPFIAALAQVLALTGSLPDALALAEEALSRVQRSDARWLWPEVLRVKGDILLRVSDFSAAEEVLEHSLLVARQTGALFWQLRGAMTLGRLRERQGRTKEARQTLGEVHRQFTEGQNFPIFRRATGLLDRWSSD